MPTILVAEDDAAMLYVICRILKKNGYEVLEAVNGEEALRLASNYTGRISLLCTNIDMPPGMNGIELSHHMRETIPDLQVLYVTAGSKPEFAVLQSIHRRGTADRVREALDEPNPPLHCEATA